MFLLEHILSSLLTIHNFSRCNSKKKKEINVILNAKLYCMVWNDICLMNKLNQHAQLDKYLIKYSPMEFDKDLKN